VYSGRVTKKELVLDLLARAHAFVILDGRAAGVELPDFLRGDAKVVLQLGYHLPVPIPDLAVTDDGITATLSFRRAPHTVRVPWSAVYAIGDGEHPAAVFIDSLPRDLPQNEPEPPPPPAKRGSHLKLVK
jgi:hypothetical protein